MNTMDDLIEFLNEQLASRKAMAVQAKHALDEWHRGADRDDRWRLDEDGISINIKGEYVCVGTEVAVFLAFNDPDAVLADVVAKQQIIELCRDMLWENEGGPDAVAAGTLRLLALPSATHPDYREEWKP